MNAKKNPASSNGEETNHAQTNFFMCEKKGLSFPHESLQFANPSIHNTPHATQLKQIIQSF